ncbi:hypothetical protein GCM10011391_38510 [Pullulanibacillus camelliae]|uniref:Mechanosensitive ion channel n=1 Tax=Pullulanibacillus camelliae TaxID=1707096 RepID=A0A8J2YNP0_9BACL|nr:mechanosensitive ion channel [Pullulanibacillus camelliae]GGE55827.1 hypothetical protein GCM10011391_38510 [Pullulanibacillus camelliae]
MHITELFTSWTQYLGGLPNLIFALFILLVGWLISKGVSSSLTKILSKSGLDEKVGGWIAQEEEQGAPRSTPISATVGKVIYYVLLVFLYLIFFNMLNLSIVAQPIANMLSAITTAIPNVIWAALILLLAWVVAIVLKFLVEVGGRKLHIQHLLMKINTVENEDQGNRFLSMLGKIVFYLVIVLFLPAILGPLKIVGITQPLSLMIAKFLNFIPYFVAAGVIGLIGWLIAKVVRDLLANLLRTMGLDKASERLGLSEILGGRRLSSMIGTIAFVLILIPTAITVLKQLHVQGIAQPAIQMLNEVFVIIPNIVVALLMIVLGIIVGRWVSRFITNLLGSLGFNRLPSSLGLHSLKMQVPPSQWVGKIAQIVILLLFSVEALQILHFNILVTIVSVVIGYLPNLLVAIVIVGAGLYLGHLVSRLLSGIGNSVGTNMIFFSQTAKYAIFVFSLFMALDQLNVATSIIHAAFILCLGAIAVAFALSFGLGGRQFASKQLEKWEQKMASESDGHNE